MYACTLVFLFNAGILFLILRFATPVQIKHAKATAIDLLRHFPGLRAKCWLKAPRIFFSKKVWADVGAHFTYLLLQQVLQEFVLHTRRIAFPPGGRFSSTARTSLKREDKVMARSHHYYESLLNLSFSST